ncbi:MAG: AraC family transcriptional regulator [Betaproteobacteria bacterium HGW-Betaproteobacteria-11]|nr:MAG: AraC family transcriptional regulator [Betaproteobacteria bacterium HGW-Betaproteobacteria-11]
MKRASGTPRQQIKIQPTVAIGFVNGMLAGLGRTELRAGTLLDHAQIASNLLHDPGARIPVAHYAALYRLINEHLDDEGFALFSHPLRRGTFEFLCRATLSAATLEDALERIARFMRVVLEDIEIELVKNPRTAVLVMHQEQSLPVGPAGRVFAFEWLLRMIHGLAAWLVAHPLPLDEVAFPYPPPLHEADYDLIFAPRHAFDAKQLEARFPAAWLALPVRRDEAALLAFLADAPASITTLYRRDRSLSPRVREHLRNALPESPTLDQLARQFNLSPRTLHRRLEDEGTSLRALRESLRQELAIDWLTKTMRPVSRIAADLGFADAASFYRAFTAWTGHGPRDYRRKSQRGST